MEAANYDITVHPKKCCFTTFLLCQLLKTQGFFHPPFFGWVPPTFNGPNKKLQSPPRVPPSKKTPHHQAVQVVESAVAFALPVIQGATQEDLQAKKPGESGESLSLKKCRFGTQNMHFVGDDMGMMI